jgi:hypothetical protein
MSPKGGRVLYAIRNPWTARFPIFANPHEKRAGEGPCPHGSLQVDAPLTAPQARVEQTEWIA